MRPCFVAPPVLSHAKLRRVEIEYSGLIVRVTIEENGMSRFARERIPSPRRIGSQRRSCAIGW